MKIVVGFVSTDEGKAALEWAIEEAQRHGSEISVVHSIHGGGSEGAEQEHILAYRSELDEIERRLTDAGIPHVIHRLIRGASPAEDIVHVATEEGADLIVIGLRRRSRTAELILGSNSKQILFEANCPVVTVKANYKAKNA